MGHGTLKSINGQEKFLNSRRSRTVKIVTFWTWRQPFNSFWFKTLYIFLCAGGGGGGGGWSPAPPPPPPPAASAPGPEQEKVSPKTSPLLQLWRRNTIINRLKIITHIHEPAMKSPSKYWKRKAESLHNVISGSK